LVVLRLELAGVGDLRSRKQGRAHGEAGKRPERLAPQRAGVRAGDPAPFASTSGHAFVDVPSRSRRFMPR